MKRTPEEWAYEFSTRTNFSDFCEWIHKEAEEQTLNKAIKTLESRESQDLLVGLGVLQAIAVLRIMLDLAKGRCDL